MRVGATIGKKSSDSKTESETEALRTDYDFSMAARCATAARYAEGTSITAIDPEVLDAIDEIEEG
jgi:hypothetical protein